MNKGRRSVLRQVALGTAAAPLALQSDSRIGIVFYPTGSTYYSVDNVPPASANTSVLINTNGGPVELWKDRHGTAVGAPWFGIGNGAGMQICVLEVYE